MIYIRVDEFCTVFVETFLVVNETDTTTKHLTQCEKHLYISCNLKTNVIVSWI